MRKKIIIAVGIVVLMAASYFITLALANYSTDKSSQNNPNDIKPYKVETNIEMNARRVCLKHRDQTGPQTEECALGLRDEKTGKYYFIKNPEKIEGVYNDEVVKIKGILTKNDDKKYLQDGTVEIVSLSIHYDVPDNWSI